LKTQILVVDDDAGSRNALTTLLRDEGFTVVGMPGGREAMEYLRRESSPPKLIVLDLMMPDVDGWDLRHAQKLDPRLAGIPVIAVSAAGKLPDADAQFRKPLDYEKFLSVVRQYVTPGRSR
jgi:CheY-like chemotaxis protein